MPINPPKMHGSTPQMPLLDILRFSAALLVMLNHLRADQFLPYGSVYSDNRLVKQLFYGITCLGHEAVILFFVLSGFLVGGAALRRFWHGTFESGKYFIDRLSRIYIPLIPAMVFTITVCILCDTPFSWLEGMLNILSLQGTFAKAFSGNRALWSLSYEVWCYISCGALLMSFQKRTIFQVFIAMALLVASAVVFYHLKTVYLIAWLVGVGACFLPGRT